MLYSEIINRPLLWIYTAALLLLVLFQTIVFIRRGWLRALSLGLSSSQVKKGLTTGISISILPTLPVLIVFLALVPLLGVPLPWLRLSVIGSAGYEAIAAALGAQLVGEDLVINAFTIKGWVAAAWVMSVGGSVFVLWSIIAVKPISIVYERVGNKNIALVITIGTACLTGVMAYVSVAQGLGNLPTKGVVFSISFITGALLVFVQKHTKFKRISEGIMAFSMLAAMIGACIIFN